jgi:hypothetical protein
MKHFRIFVRTKLIPPLKEGNSVLVLACIEVHAEACITNAWVEVTNLVCVGHVRTLTHMDCMEENVFGMLLPDLMENGKTCCRELHAVSEL